jgi:undecaprenyl pyrophosphate synthase
MDGNRRWAKERGLPTFDGHQMGYKKVREVSELFFTHGVKFVSLFGFSTENWSRSAEEVGYLMKLFEHAVKVEIDELNKNNIRLIISGRLIELPGNLPQLCHEAMEKTKDNQKGTINLCLNYGGHAEIVDAVKKIIAGYSFGSDSHVLTIEDNLQGIEDQRPKTKDPIQLEQVTEELITKNLYNDLPAPDVIVRTSGEKRLSGFLLWQSVYSELIFIDKYWPAFDVEDVLFVLEEYNRRQRRFGK